MIMSALSGRKHPMSSTHRCWRLTFAVQMQTLHKPTEVRGQTACRRQNVWNEKLLHDVRCCAALYLLMPTWVMIWDKRNQEDEIWHWECHSVGLRILRLEVWKLRSFFSAPSWALCCGCSIEVLQLCNAPLFSLDLHTHLILLGISSNLISVNACSFAWKVKDQCVLQHAEVEEIFVYLSHAGIRQWRLDSERHLMELVACKWSSWDLIKRHGLDWI